MNINKTLEQAPNEIAVLAHKVEEARFCWKQSELNLKALEAKTHLLVKAEKPDLTVADLRAEVDCAVEEARLAVLMHESEYKKDMIELEKWINAFNSARKLANVKIEEMRSLHQTVGGK